MLFPSKAVDLIDVLILALELEAEAIVIHDVALSKDIIGLLLFILYHLQDRIFVWHVLDP